MYKIINFLVDRAFMKKYYKYKGEIFYVIS